MLLGPRVEGSRWGCRARGHGPGCRGLAGQKGAGPPRERAQSASLLSASCRPASPACPDQRVMYTVLECQPLFDSSDMTITEWVQIAQTIEVR